MSVNVIKDGEEIRVSEMVRVQREHLVHGHGGHDSFTGSIFHHDSTEVAEAVTPAIAEYLWAEFGIEVGDMDIEVIDPNGPDVEVV